MKITIELDVDQSKFNAIMDIVNSQNVPAVPAVPAVPPPPPVTTKVEMPIPKNKEFVDMMIKVGKLVTDGAISHEKIEEMAKTLGLIEKGKGVIAKLADLPNLIPQFMKMIEDHVNSTPPI